MADKRLRVLAITYCFTPIQLPATMRLLKWFKGLDELGCEVTALAIEPDSFNGPKDEKLNDLVPGNVKALRVWSPENSLLYRALGRQRGIFYKLFEPRKMEWYRPALKALKRIDPGGFDVIFSCSQPHSSHLLGRWLKKKTGKRWVAYFSDPWTDNPYAEYSSKKIFEYNLKLEESVIREADFLFFTSEETVELVMGKYPAALKAKCGVLPHCFIPEWYAMRQGETRERDGKISFLQTGNFYGPRNPMPLINSLSRVKREADISKRFDIVSYGHVDPKYREIIQKHGLENVISLKATIPYIDSLSAMTAADYLLLIDAPLRNVKESIFLPSKLIDYIGSRKPIIGITPGKGASARVLRETGNIVCELENEDALYKVFMDICKGTLNVRNDENAMQKYHYRNVVRSLKNVLEGAI